jgi:transposase-like protein
MAELQRPAIFKWRHFSPEVILCAVRRYLCYFPSYRDAQELLVERGLEIDHTDHRAIKKRIRAKQHFREFSCARRTIQGYETMHKIRKGQVRRVTKGDIRVENRFIDQVFGPAA